MSQVFFAKNGTQFGQIWPPETQLRFTSPYRGSPFCTIFHHPNNREIWYSNVLTSPLTPEDPPHHQPQHQPIIVLMVSIGFETKVAHFTPTTSQKRYWPKLNCKESPQTDINCCSLSDHPTKLKSSQISGERKTV